MSKGDEIDTFWHVLRRRESARNSKNVAKEIPIPDADNVQSKQPIVVRAETDDWSAQWNCKTYDERAAFTLKKPLIEESELQPGDSLKFIVWQKVIGEADDGPIQRELFEQSNRELLEAIYEAIVDEEGDR